MELIAYIYDKQRNLLTQIFDFTDFTASVKINNIGTASFTLSYDNVGCKYEYLKEFNKIEIADKNENIIFEGVIRWADTSLDGVKVVCATHEYYLKNRLILSSSPANYTGTISNLISTVLSNINAVENTGLTLDSDVTTTISGKTYQIGTSVYDVLTDLAWWGYEFKVKNRKILLKYNIGADKSIEANPDYTQLKYDATDHWEDTIAKATGSYDVDNMKNVVLETNTNSVVSDSSSITDYGRIEGTYTNSDALNATGYLNERKASIKEFTVTPQTNDFFIADIGDTVAVYIYTGSDMMFYNGTMKVIGKKYSFTGDIEKVDLELSKSKVGTLSFDEFLRGLNERVRLLEI